MSKPHNPEDVPMEKRVAEVLELVKISCIALADDAESLRITSVWTTSQHLTISVNPGSNKPGLLIGRDGRLAKSIRILAKSVGQKLKIPHVSVTFEG